MRSLLLLACSNRKTTGKDYLPAIEMYDGGSFRIIRKQQREGRFPRNVDIVILSAKFGLINSSTQIDNYDIRMNKQRAVEMQPEVQSSLSKLISKKNYLEIYIDLGANYFPAIQGFIAPQDIKITIAKGRIGERLRDLKKWLSSQYSSPNINLIY